MTQENGNEGMPKRGISNNLIVTLVIVAVIISAIGTWAVLESLSKNSGEVYEDNTNVATVTMNILPSVPPAIPSMKSNTSG